MKKNLLLTLFIFFIIKVNAQTTLLVTATTDTGTGSLRAAVAAAVTGDTIRFDPSLISSGNATITLTSGEILFANESLVFKGLYNANDTLFISGNNSSRIFHVNSGNITLDSMVLINGNSSEGGAVAMFGGNSLIVSNSILSHNAVGYDGGAIESYGANSSTITIFNSTISNNSAYYQGGGIENLSSDSAIVTIINSTISNDSAFVGDGGAGILANGSNSLVTVTNSTIVNNMAISNNLAQSASGISGGGIYSYASGSSTVNITNSTISNNVVQNPSGTEGSGVYSYGTIYSAVNTVSSIIALNNGASNIFNTSNGNTSIPIISGGYNIFSDANVAGSSCSDQLGISTLNLGPLQNNGGNTFTMLPEAGSVAVDRGNPADNSTAQNDVTPHGIRDAGAAESILSAVSSTHANTVCGTDTLHITSSYYAIWSSAATLYSDNTGTLYNNFWTADSIFVKTHNNTYVFANFGTNDCPLGTDSILVTVTNNNGSLATSTTSDSSILDGSTQLNDSNCQVIALVTPSGDNPVNGTIYVTDSVNGSVATFNGSPYLSRVYDIIPAQNAANATATITLYYADAEMQAYNNYLSANDLTGTFPDAPTITDPADTSAAKATFRIIQYHGLFAGPYSDTNGIVVPIISMFYNSAAARWEVTFNVTGFSGFYAYTNKIAAPLALTWQYLTAIENGINNEIMWKVSENDNNGTFEVQSSINGRSFNTIASIPYNNMQVVYSTEDVNPPAQVYYRIKYIGKDGSVSYSATKMINRQQPNAFVITIYPVPAKNDLTVETYSPVATIITYTIVDAIGQVVKVEQHSAMQSAKQLLDISTLNNGIYLIKVTDALGNIETKKFSKL